MFADIMIIFFVAAYSILVIKKLIRDKKSGVCTGCTSHSCKGCKGCDSAYIESLIRNAKERT